ncbi:hypothetical protein AAGW05_12645 [Arthrobacter sp. LAPM80]|uniref:hypothetical protein n=1 Tax=Arthrobacter sp. LAPM80 TaxID=3141788 RepID=UPI00398AB0F6
MKKFLTISATVAAALIALAGCSTGASDGSMQGMNHGSATTSTMQAAVAVGERNAADTMSAQMMPPTTSKRWR